MPEIDDLDVEDQASWVNELIESNLSHFTYFEVASELVDKLVERKVLSKFNQKRLAELEGGDRLEELLSVVRKKGWDNFKTTRETLYQLYPDFETLKVWNETVMEIPPVVLGVKYLTQLESKLDNMNLNENNTSTDTNENNTTTTNTNGGLEEDGHKGVKTIPVTKEDYSKVSSGEALPLYNMGRRPLPGLCLIVNNEDYRKVEELKDRKGSSVDSKRIEKLFTGLGWHVESQKNLTKLSFLRLIELIQQYTNLNKYNCFVAVFLSHGEGESLNCVDGKLLNIDDIINSFKGDVCPALAGIAKWFIIQACRGSEFNQEVEHDAPGDSTTCEIQSVKPISIPACADFLISYATAPGYYSFRNTQKGSWFIQSLCEVLKEFHYKEDVSSMMTRVNRKVALGHHTYRPDIQEYVRQMPCHVNMLTGALYLHKTYNV